jgi:hypothetical protein
MRIVLALFLYGILNQVEFMTPWDLDARYVVQEQQNEIARERAMNE